MPHKVRCRILNFDYLGIPISKVGFIGYGKSNKGVLKYLKSKYPYLSFTVRSLSLKDEIDFKADKIVLGEDYLKNIDEDILFVSPSVRRDIKQIQEAQKRGCIITSDVEFFFSLKKCDTYAVTGSDGKSTTTYLTASLLSNFYKSAIPSANFGEPLTPHLDDMDGYAYVTELSSFQLMNFTPKTKRAVITNITKNHLNWHKSFGEYIAAKRNILKYSEERIINFDCPISRGFLCDYNAFALISLSANYRELKKKCNAELYFTYENGFLLLNGNKLLHSSEIAIPGMHNVFNFMAAYALGYGKFSNADFSRLAKEFSGLAHRCNKIGTFNGISYINSSIDSSPKRTVATLSVMKERVIIILGGRSKGLDYKELLPSLKEKTKYIILTGESGKEIENILKNEKRLFGFDIPFTYIDDFFYSLEFASSIAVFGDTVLLSPASVSFDRFSNFEERGEKFESFIFKLYNRTTETKGN